MVLCPAGSVPQLKTNRSEDVTNLINTVSLSIVAQVCQVHEQLEQPKERSFELLLKTRKINKQGYGRDSYYSEFSLMQVSTQFTIYFT